MEALKFWGMVCLFIAIGLILFGLIRARQARKAIERRETGRRLADKLQSDIDDGMRAAEARKQARETRPAPPVAARPAAPAAQPNRRASDDVPAPMPLYYDSTATPHYSSPSYGPCSSSDSSSSYSSSDSSSSSSDSGSSCSSSSSSD